MDLRIWALASAIISLCGCSPRPIEVTADGGAVPPWEEILQAWRADPSGHVAVSVSVTGTHKLLYGYEASWTATPFFYEVEVNGPMANKGKVTITDRLVDEAGKTIHINTKPQEGAPNLANLFALANDFLNPFGLLSAEPASKNRTAKGLTYHWTFSSGNTRRDYVCEVDAVTKRPMKLTVSQPVWKSPTEITYSFRTASATKVKAKPNTGKGVPWATAVNGSATLASLRGAVALSLDRPSVAATDPLTGRPDPWKLGFDVRPVKQWRDLKGDVGRVRLPASWPAPTTLEERTYADPASGKAVYEARAYFARGDIKWRVTVTESESARLAFEMDLRVGEVIKDDQERSFCFYEDNLGAGSPNSISWMQSKTLFISIESIKADRVRLLHLSEELRRP